MLTFGSPPRKTSFPRGVMLLAVFASCVAFFGGLGIMSVLPDSAMAGPPTAHPVKQVVYYQELKNLGDGNYLCDVWSQSNRDTTIIKLTASEKAKLQRAYIK